MLLANIEIGVVFDVRLFGREGFEFLPHSDPVGGQVVADEVFEAGRGVVLFEQFLL